MTKVLFECSDEHFDKNIFFEKHFFILFSDFERDIFWLPSKSLKKVVKTVFYPFRKQSEVTEFFEVFSLVFGTYSEFEQKFSDIWLKLFRKADKTASTRSDEHFDGKQFFQNVLFLIVFLEFFRNFFRFLDKFLWENCQNCFQSV